MGDRGVAAIFTADVVCYFFTQMPVWRQLQPLVNSWQVGVMMGGTVGTAHPLMQTKVGTMVEVPPPPPDEALNDVNCVEGDTCAPTPPPDEGVEICVGCSDGDGATDGVFVSGPDAGYVAAAGSGSGGGDVMFVGVTGTPVGSTSQPGPSPRGPVERIGAIPCRGPTTKFEIAPCSGPAPCRGPAPNNGPEPQMGSPSKGGLPL